MMAASSSQHRCVFVGNIPYDATEEQLIQICEEVGPVVSFRLVLDRETGKPKGYGFCEYKDEETALSARRNLQGYEINGRQLRVDFAENDKGSDRNREQGRGGPGLTSNIDAADAQKPLGAPAIIGDPALHQPIGLPLAATAASVMAGALGGPQTSSIFSNLNGFQSQSGLGNDPLTHHLSKMSRTQLFEVMSEMKAMATKNKALVRQLLVASPQLPKAIFQAQIMLGLVPPQALQMLNIRQSSSSILQPSVQNGPQDQQPVLPSHHGQTPHVQNKMHIGLLPRIPGQALPVPQNTLIPQPSSTLPPLHASMQPRFQQPQPQVLLQTTLPGLSGVSSVRPQPLAGLSVQPQAPSASSTAMKQQIQPPLLQHPRPVGAAHTGHTQFPLPPNPSVLPRPLSSQPAFQPGSSNPPVFVGGVETISREAAQGDALLNLPLGLAEKTSTASDILEPKNHPSKLARLEDGSSATRTMSGNTSTAGSIPVQVSGTSSTSASRLPTSDGSLQPEEKTLQLPPEVESALLQQVMSLTPEQLSSLPPEQRQQVLQLQQMLR